MACIQQYSHINTILVLYIVYICIVYVCIALTGSMMSSGARSPRAFMRVYSISAVVSISS